MIQPLLRQLKNPNVTRRGSLRDCRTMSPDNKYNTLKNTEVLSDESKVELCLRGMFSSQDQTTLSNHEDTTLSRCRGRGAKITSTP